MNNPLLSHAHACSLAITSNHLWYGTTGNAVMLKPPNFQALGTPKGALRVELRSKGARGETQKCLANIRGRETDTNICHLAPAVWEQVRAPICVSFFLFWLVVAPPNLSANEYIHGAHIHMCTTNQPTKNQTFYRERARGYGHRCP